MVLFLVNCQIIFSILNNPKFNVTVDVLSKKYGRSFRNFSDNDYLSVLNYLNLDKNFGGNTCPDKLTDIFLRALNEMLDIMAPVKLL